MSKDNTAWKKGKYIKTEQLKDFKQDLEKVKNILNTNLEDLKKTLDSMKDYTKKDYKKDK